VYLATFRKDPTRQYAIKSINRSQVKERALKRLQNELEILK